MKRYRRPIRSKCPHRTRPWFDASPEPSRYRPEKAGLSLLLALLCVALSLTCRPAHVAADSSQPDSHTGNAPPPPSGLRPVRVQLAAKARSLRVRADRPIYVLNEDGVRVDSIKAGAWQTIEYRSAGGVRLGSRSRSTPFGLETDWNRPMTVSLRNGDKWSDERRFPGRLEVRAHDAGLSVINLVDIEQYVGCVVAYEVWPTFQTEAYRSQAIVARTYALYEMTRRQSSSYDLSAAQNSQVYRGLRDDVVGRRAAEAARFTRGLVLTYPRNGADKLFCTYYSAACGGMSQSAVIFGEAGSIAPLEGGVRCDYCAIAPGDTYRWGPVTMKLTDVRARIVARYPDLRALGGFRSIEIAVRTATGRPEHLRLHGAGGKSEDILAERFRLAVGPSKIKSTDFSIECTDRHVTFKNGRGFGHGLGLCQWGMEGQARQGRRTGEILRFYFPGAKMVGVYD